MASPFHSDDGIMSVQAARDVDGCVQVPGSKSLTNRYLLLAGLAEGTSILRGALASEDTHYMRSALQALGVEVTAAKTDWVIQGRSQWHSPQTSLFVGNAGTAMRFLTPALAVRDFAVEITGNARMAVRPIGDLVEGLTQLGGCIQYLGKPGCPPLRIQGPLLGDRIGIRGDASSQYLSGLLMALPLMNPPPAIELTSELVSHTYVAMTLDCLKRFGVHWEVSKDYQRFTLSPDQTFQPVDLTVEPDASTASYWFGLPLMVGGRITVAGVPRESHQGDFGMLKILEEMGAEITYRGDEVTVSAAQLHGIDVDMNTMSDVAPTIAVIATRAIGPTTIRNVGNMRIKECDRIETLQRGFAALGLVMKTGEDWMRIEPGVPNKEATLDPQEDHRMAMVFALLGLAYGGVRIQDPNCVAKTYPDFWLNMAAKTQTLT